MTDIKPMRLSSEDLARLLDPDTSETMRQKLLAQVAECPESAEALKVALALESDSRAFADALSEPVEDDGSEASTGAPWIRQWAMAASLVMAVAAGFFLFQSSDPAPVVLRGASADVSPEPGAALSAVPTVFRWSNPTPGRFVLLDTLAQPLFEATADNGEMAVDGELEHVLSAGGQFLWRVEIDGRTLGPFPITIEPAD